MAARVGVIQNAATEYRIIVSGSQWFADIRVERLGKGVSFLKSLFFSLYERETFSCPPLKKGD
jgi:hypothetical protein